MADVDTKVKEAGVSESTNHMYSVNITNAFLLVFRLHIFRYLQA